MGRTFRRKKTRDGKLSKLNTHRDLPDFEEFSDYDEWGEPRDNLEEEYNNAKLHTKETDVERPEDESSGQKHKR